MKMVSLFLFLFTCFAFAQVDDSFTPADKQDLDVKGAIVPPTEEQKKHIKNPTKKATKAIQKKAVKKAIKKKKAKKPTT